MQGDRGLTLETGGIMAVAGFAATKLAPGMASVIFLSGLLAMALGGIFLLCGLTGEA